MTAREAYVKAKKAQKRLPELEPIIVKDGFYAYSYAKYVIKGRWFEAEPTIMQDAHSAYCYSKDVIKGRWLEVEPTIMQDEEWAYLYARDIIKGRWYDAEERFVQSIFRDDYIEIFFDEPVVTKDKVDIIPWERKNLQGYFAPASLFEQKVSVLDMMVTE